MTWQCDGYSYLVRLEKGERLVESLTALIKQENIQGGWVQAIGGAMWVEIGFYQLENIHEYEWEKFDAMMEIAGIQGNVSWVGTEPMLHLHGTFSDADMRTYGGHVKELEVSGTCEVRIQLWHKGTLTRAHNEEVGLKLLDLS